MLCLSVKNVAIRVLRPSELNTEIMFSESVPNHAVPGEASI